LVRLEFPRVTNEPDQIVSEFRSRFYDTKKFFDPFAGGKFAQYLFAAHEKASAPYTEDSARYLIGEAHLFIEASHNYSNRAEAPVAV
jgi:sulfite reductase (ferredoxin)